MKVYTFSVFDNGAIAVESFGTYEQARVHCWSVTCESQFIAIAEDDKTRWFRKVAGLTFAPKPAHLIPESILSRLESVALSNDLQTMTSAWAVFDEASRTSFE
jgi:hypothetical protein